MSPTWTHTTAPTSLCLFGFLSVIFQKLIFTSTSDLPLISSCRFPISLKNLRRVPPSNHPEHTSSTALPSNESISPAAPGILFKQKSSFITTIHTSQNSRFQSRTASSPESRVSFIECRRSEHSISQTLFSPKIDR